MKLHCIKTNTSLEDPQIQASLVHTDSDIWHQFQVFKTLFWKC